MIVNNIILQTIMSRYIYLYHVRILHITSCISSNFPVIVAPMTAVNYLLSSNPFILTFCSLLIYCPIGGWNILWSQLKIKCNSMFSNSTAVCSKNVVFKQSKLSGVTLNVAVSLCLTNPILKNRILLLSFCL